MQLAQPPSVERAVVPDIDALVTLKLAMFEESGRGHLLPPEKRQLVARDYARLYAEQLAAHFVVRSEGVIVACAGAFLKSDLPYCYFDPSTYGFIGDVYTAPSARGNGLARLLSSAAIDWLRSGGVKTIRLLASEVARPLYGSLGFKMTDEMVLHL